MPEVAPELLSDDDDFAFEPTGWDLASAIGLGVDPESNRPLLDELADGMLVWAEGPEADRLAAEAAAGLWSDEFSRSIREGLERLRAMGPDWRVAAEGALEELDLLGCRSEIAREVVANLAMQLSQLDHPWTFCVLCIDEALPRTPTDDRRALARSVALVARRNAAVPDDEVRAALLGAAFGPPVLRLATDERRRAVRERLARIGRLGRTSLPNLASELKAIGAESLPEEAANDDIWEEVCRYLLADVARPELN